MSLSAEEYLQRIWENGVEVSGLLAPDTFKDVNGAIINTISTVWTPATGKRIRVMGGCISVSAACNVLFEDNVAGSNHFIFRTPKLLADTPYNFDLGNGVLLSAINNVVKATGSASATLTGTLYGKEE